MPFIAFLIFYLFVAIFVPSWLQIAAVFSKFGSSHINWFIICFAFRFTIASFCSDGVPLFNLALMPITILGDFFIRFISLWVISGWGNSVNYAVIILHIMWDLFCFKNRLMRKSAAGYQLVFRTLGFSVLLSS